MNGEQLMVLLALGTMCGCSAVIGVLFGAWASCRAHKGDKCQPG